MDGENKQGETAVSEATHRKERWRLPSPLSWFRSLGRLGAWLVITTIVAVIGVIVAVLCEDPLKAWWNSRRTVSQVTVLVPVQGNAMPTGVKGADPYEDKISNDVANTITNTVNVFRDTHRGIQADSVVFHHYVEGRTDADRKSVAREQISRAAAEGRPAVVVIGHTTSQATLDAAPVYAEYRLPILMPFATKSGITEEIMRVRGSDASIPRALAFPPPNKAQARAIAKLLSAEGITSVVIFRDAANRAYSDDCANELIKILENDRTKAGLPPIEVVADIAVGGEIGRWYNTGDLAVAQAQAYVVIAMTKPSLEVARQLARAPAVTWPKFVVCTDGAIDDYLTERLAPAIRTVGTVPATKKGAQPRKVPFPPFYIAFPETDVVPKGYEKVFRNNQIRGLSHSAYLADAIFVAYDVGLKTLGARRNKVVQRFSESLDSFINFNKDSGASLPGSVLVSEDRSYTFLTTGSRASKAGYTLFRIDPKTLAYQVVPDYVNVGGE